MVSVDYYVNNEADAMQNKRVTGAVTKDHANPKRRHVSFDTSASDI